MKNILVLGGTGFVGRHVCEKLVRAGYTVTVPTRRRSNAAPVQHLPGLTVLELDVHQPAALAQAVAGHDAVVNLIAILHGDQASFEKTHVALPQSLVRACRQAGVQRVVHVSALGVNGSNPNAAPSMYLRSKGLGEAALATLAGGDGSAGGKSADRGSDVGTRGGPEAGRASVAILRPSVIFGREDKFLNLFAALQRVFPFMPLAGADARFQPVWVQDVAEAVVRCVGRPMAAGSLEVFEACGPEVFTLKQLVHLAGRLAGVGEGRGRPVFGIPDWAGQLQARAMECLPGQPLMSRDNLASMQVDNVATGQVPGLAALGIQAAAVEPVAAGYLHP